MRRASFLALLLLAWAPIAFSQDAKESKQPPKGAAPKGPPQPIVLNSDDVAAFAEPPEGFDARRDGTPHGAIEMVAYNSKTVGTRRKTQVYTPPGYSKEKKYPVHYLLHGIGGDETEWQRFAQPETLVDNLIAVGKAVPMIVVMPNGRAQKNDRAEGNVFAAAPSFAVFEKDLRERMGTIPLDMHVRLANLALVEQPTSEGISNSTASSPGTSKRIPPSRRRRRPMSVAASTWFPTSARSGTSSRSPRRTRTTGIPTYEPRSASSPKRRSYRRRPSGEPFESPSSFSRGP